MTKRTIAKLALFVFMAAVLASCRGPKECWGVSSDSRAPSEEPAEMSGN